MENQTQLTELETLLARTLHALNISAKVSIPILVNLETEEQQMQMLEYLNKVLKKEPTAEEILQKAIEITRG